MLRLHIRRGVQHRHGGEGRSERLKVPTAAPDDEVQRTAHLPSERDKVLAVPVAARSRCARRELEGHGRDLAALGYKGGPALVITGVRPLTCSAHGTPLAMNSENVSAMRFMFCRLSRRVTSVNSE